MHYEITQTFILFLLNQVTVVVVFLVCHSVKLFINGYEVYQLVKSNVETINANDHDEVTAPPRLSMNASNILDESEEDPGATK